MPLLIDRKPVADDRWQLVEDAENLPASGDLLLPLGLYLENKDALSAQAGEIAVRVNGDDDLTPVLESLDSFPMIAVEFPAFRDGRGFSLARILRRAGFKGELRAVGNPARDQLGYMERCGFNAYEFSEEVYSDDFLKAFEEISVHYQGSADDPRPIYLQS
ncbi:DUF934 domain-containing protein [Marinobacterium lutimaris]|uniref:Uncharacterized conserved protein, DUF934 family n=1 Tax=Marinobacterium lutimaris TaxID=568106 RepID=A0A1H5YIX1_9GAMM|nr:DUF934 domain-containing protein [Marinobacterium lutimaris]SEG23487.1 Uncharacterized conserved protein, DUF934 family [Marinobacterium lutimaris]